MTYIENIFLCLALPMLLSLLFTSGSPRRFTLFVVLGMATCLLSAYVSSFFMGRHQCSAVTTAIEIAPVCEEILKLLPLLLYFLIFEPDSHKLTPAAIGIAVGFATFENVCYLTENGAGSFVFPAHPRHVRRGPASGLRHPDRSGTGLCVPPSVAHLHRHGGNSGGLHGAARHLQSADHRRRLLADGRVLLSLCHYRHPVCGKAAPQGQAHCFSLTVSRSFPEREIFLNFFQIWVKGIGANCIIGDREDGKQPL